MTMVRVVRNTRAADCEHCEALLKDVYKCLDGELNDMRNRNNHE